MIKRYILTMHPDGAERRILPEMAYSLYSELMRSVDPLYGEQFHEQGFTPISQYLHTDRDGQLRWYVSLLREDAIDAFSDILLQNRTYTIFDQNLRFCVENMEKQEITCADIIRKATGAQSRIVMEFLTPASFRSSGRYMLFPEVSLILHSLVQSWNAVCTEYPLDDEDMLTLLMSGVDIHSYRLSSSVFRLKGAAIPSFQGRLQFRTKLSPPILSVLQILMYFSEYAGIGIKTALGMGGVRFQSELLR